MIHYSCDRCKRVINYDQCRHIGFDIAYDIFNALDPHRLLFCNKCWDEFTATARSWFART